MALAHAVGDKVEAAYRRGDLFEKRRQLAEAWAQFCDREEPAEGGLIWRPARVAFLGSLRAEERRCHREPRQLHTAATTAAAIPTAVFGPDPVVIRRMSCVWGSGLARGPLGAPGER
jgi:hypothetical protein